MADQQRDPAIQHAIEKLGLRYVREKVTRSGYRVHVLTNGWEVTDAGLVRVAMWCHEDGCCDWLQPQAVTKISLRRST